MPDNEPSWYEDAFKAYQQSPGLLQMLPGSGAFQAAPPMPREAPEVQQVPLSPGPDRTPPAESGPGPSEYAGEDLGVDQQSQMLDQILQELRNISRILQNAST